LWKIRFLFLGAIIHIGGIGYASYGNYYYFAFNVPAEWINEVKYASCISSVEDYIDSVSLFKSDQNVYVSSTGTNDDNCGTEGRSCKTVTYSYTNRISADNPSIYILNSITDDTGGDWGFTPGAMPLMVRGVLSGGNSGFVLLVFVFFILFVSVMRVGFLEVVLHSTLRDRLTL
jgi:hypothetical protein